MRGYTGRILFVDLTHRTWREETIPDEVYENYLSGVGLGAHILYNRMPAGADPLGPHNILGFVSGILTGTGALFSGRWLVVGKSPLTGGWGDANCGGNFGPAIKQCGYDGIFFQGVADEPLYLYADGQTVELRSAADLWGKDAVETEAALIAQSGGGRKTRVACIGMAGEKRSLISGICNDRGRMAARSGLGAVMGSKNLKAVVLAGSKPIQCADAPEIKRLSKACSRLIPKSKLPVPAWVFPLVIQFMTFGGRASRMDGMMAMGPLRTWGTITGNQVGVATGDTPIKNWQGSRADYPSSAINPDRMIRREEKKYHCYACPLGCGGICTGNGSYTETHKPEYETTTSLGPLLLNRDLDSIFDLGDLLNRAGMDTISAGATVAFAIECFENGLLTESDTGGLRLTWGDTGAIVRLVEMMIAREGIGDLLADGVKAAAARIGQGAEKFAVHAGGQELPMHDPRQDPGYGLHYVVEPTPGRHTVGSSLTWESLRLWQKVSWLPEIPKSYPVSSRYQASPGNGLQAAGASMAKMVIDGAGLCTFGLNPGVDRFPLFEYLNAATGWNKTPDEYMHIGKRVQTLRQLFNVREGVDPAAVMVNPRAYGDPPLARGPLKGKRVNLRAMQKTYWQAMGWDSDTGQPLPETIAELGLPA